MVLGYVAPYYVLGQDVAITVHDNLDSNLVWMKLLLEGGYFTDWSKEIIPQIMGGMPVRSLAPIYDLSALMLGVFGRFWGYVVLKTMMAFTGYAGMWVLLRRFVMPGESVWITGGVALCYGILPFWGFAFSVPLLPFLFAAFLAFRERGWRVSLWPWAVMVLAGFSTSLILIGVFFIAVCGLWALFDFAFRRRKPWPVFAALVVLSATYVLSHIRIFIGFLTPGEPSHRLEIDSIFQYDGLIFSRFFEVFTKGWYHSASVHFLFLPIILMGLFVVAFGLTGKRDTGIEGLRKAVSTNGIVLINLVEFLILSSLWYAIVNWGGLQWLINPITSIVPIQLGRLQFLQPVAWYVALAIALLLIWKLGKFGKALAFVVLGVQIVFLFSLFEARGEESAPSYREFYAENLFKSIKNALGDPAEYRIISVGLHPAIAQYNGFYTLDGYSPDYPLTYKHSFQKMIQGELDKSPELSRNFIGWGSRAYAFSAELGREYTFQKGSDVVISDLDYDWEAFRRMGGDYVFSSVIIEDGDLELVGIFKESQSAWDVYVYEISSEKPLILSHHASACENLRH